MESNCNENLFRFDNKHCKYCHRPFYHCFNYRNYVLLFHISTYKKRKRILRERLFIFRNNLKEDILKDEREFIQSYELYEELARVDEKGYEWNWFLIKIKNWSVFILYLRKISLVEINFNNYWKVKELMFLINNLVMDDKKYVTLSIKLTELDAAINKTMTIWGNKKEDIFSVKSVFGKYKSEQCGT